MKTIVSIASALLLCSSLAMAATSKTESTETVTKAPTQIQLQVQKPDDKQLKRCPNGTLEIAGKCHGKAEPCMSDSECCSKNCMGGACY